MLSFFPRGVLDEILNIIGSVSEGFPSYSYSYKPGPGEFPVAGAFLLMLLLSFSLFETSPFLLTTFQHFNFGQFERS